MTDGWYDVIVAGGGAIGATIAWRLGQKGHRVLLLERETLGCGASSAAAGMLGAQAEMDAAGPLFQLSMQSRSMYRSFAQELLEETGIDIQLADIGMLRAAHSEDEAERLRRRGVWQRAAGARADWMTAEEVARREPCLGPTFGALHLPDDGHVSASLLARSVAAAAKRRAHVMEGAPVLSYEFEGEGVRVRTPQADFHASFLVLAAGAWTDAIAGPSDRSVHVGPVKGQLLSVRPTGAKRLRQTVFADAVYLVPKRDGSVIAGATEEHGAGFDARVTVRGVQGLLQAVGAVAPGLAEAVFERAWMGFRPACTHSLPVIGPDPVYPRLLYAVGHFRSGILLAPATGRMIEEAVAGVPCREEWRAFLPDARAGRLAEHAGGVV